MFGPVSMRHVLIQLLKDDLPKATLAMAETEIFGPDYREQSEHGLQDIPGQRYRETFRQASSRLEKVTEHFPKPPPVELERLHVVTERELDALNNRLGVLWQECSVCQEEKRHLDEEWRLVSQLQNTLDNFANLDLDLGVLDGDKTFLDVNIGVVPAVNLQRMEEALSLARFLVYRFLLSEGNAHVIVIGQKDKQAQHVASVLESAGFRPLPIPPELRDEPNKVQRQLAQRRARITRKRAALEQRVLKHATDSATFIAQARATLALAEPLVNLDKAARCSSQLVIISGWVPARELAALETKLNATRDHPFLMTSRRPNSQERAEVPSLIKSNPLLSPFSSLVTQYGIPRYGEIDPSMVFAITFVLMFGMMFGDVGHGAVIASGAFLFRDRLKRFTTLALIAGFSSILFGFLYGSIFGFEHVLTPLWMSPLSNPILMLKIALGWGIGFLLLTSVLSIYNRVIVNDWLGALLGSNGFVYVALYIGLLWGAYNAFNGNDFGILPALLLWGSLGALAYYKWQASHAPRGERIMVVLVESFETIMGSISGTLSFLRVAAFSLNHVALAIAVFTLADMLGPTGHWLMIVLGNVFILVLEGAIVAIQTLRLEYYEGFTRFYSGDGIEFQPLRLNREIALTSAQPATTQ